MIENLPDWARIGIIVAGWMLGARIGWFLMDNWLEGRRRRREEREAAARNVTPR